MNYTKEQVVAIVSEAKQAARLAADEFFQEKMGGRDQGCCGFAWVEIHGTNLASRSRSWNKSP